MKRAIIAKDSEEIQNRVNFLQGIGEYLVSNNKMKHYYFLSNSRYFDGWFHRLISCTGRDIDKTLMLFLGTPTHEELKMIDVAYFSAISRFKEMVLNEET